MKFGKDLNFTNVLVDLKDEEWLERQRFAGKVTAQCLSFLENEVKNFTNKTPLQLSREADIFIQDNSCTATFKGHDGFPEAVCISVNKGLVHGIPKDIPFQEGDIISFDLGATYKSAIADSALTVGYGKILDQHTKLIDAGKRALAKGILAIKPGKRLGVIGQAIHKSAKGDGFGSISNYGGHGISEDKAHAQPFVSNKSDEHTGIRLQPGLTIAIEPMLVIGSIDTKIDEDGWTVNTKDIGVHHEHTIYLHKDHVEVITFREDEIYLKRQNAYKF